MATQAVLTESEQQEIIHRQGFLIARDVALGWSNTLGAHAPIGTCAAIDAFAQILACELGAQSTADFLDELAAAIRKAGEKGVA